VLSTIISNFQMSASALSTFLKQDLLEDEVTELLGDRSRSGGRRWMRSRDTARLRQARGGCR
jgi:hypothetical protein